MKEAQRCPFASATACSLALCRPLRKAQDRLRGTIVFRHIPPAQPVAVDEHDAVKHLAVINVRPAVALLKERSQPLHLIVRPPKQAANASLFAEPESSHISPDQEERRRSTTPSRCPSTLAEHIALRRNETYFLIGAKENGHSIRRNLYGREIDEADRMYGSAVVLPTT